MPYYRQVGEIPRKRHTQFRQPDGGLYAEELMGVEGFSSDSALLYHRTCRRRSCPARCSRGRPSSADPTIRSSRGTSRRTSSTRVPAADAVPGRQQLMGNADVRLSYVVADGALAALSQRDRGRVRLCRGGRVSWRPSSARSRSARRLRRHPDLDDAPVGAGRGRTAAAARDRGLGPHRPAAALLSSKGPVSRALARTASGTCAAPPNRLVEGDDVEVLVRHRRQRRRGHAASMRTTRSTSSAGTAASIPTCSRSTTSSRSPGGCTSRRRCTRPSRGRTSSSARSCRGCSTTTRTASPRRTTTPTSTPTR